MPEAENWDSYNFPSPLLSIRAAWPNADSRSKQDLNNSLHMFQVPEKKDGQKSKGRPEFYY